MPTLKSSLRSASVLILCGTLATTAPAHASGIPVVDGASIADRAIKHAETIAKSAEQIAVLKDQLDSQRRQLESLTGVRNLGDILNNPAIREALPEDARQVLRKANVGGGDFGEVLKRIEREERLTGNYETDRKNLDTRAENLTLRSQALMEQTQKAMTARMTQVSKLQAQINQTEDPKAIADLQARLLVEQANIQVDQSRADGLQRQLQAEQALMEAQADKLAASAFSIDAIRAPLPGVR
ncbi:P-type DNA transfer protein VirB5 [Achromobacter xylosoxidans]|jgi:type IV secretion system protein VirB5|uniref:P-type DNA transfer protein VirB5 n=1 Tax=Achromobacter ruhlandii TaxID=72557 RepID=A0A848NJH2_9BURK|nr:MULTISPECIES: P-type DNA transfer protein VirB5 [Achromobacter]MDZ5618034.1 P-type DNA transfer protein VirB5 [Achromobacter xylosoxidans]MDZ5625877.1 P-type DNA transfer protein VirB5 [Achromobacter xylosoxidans]MDZ5685467.1 P-type DNA transfer protein VirB5 [Achromobacter xylosoxidans]NMU89785.1 P-type DNA transfer protein VirB5 [Achromobacter ruhlandii]CUJ71043.1 P-type DNA transfer protein VirB5 [Achromobacter sp. 2789STDY5608621]